MMMRSKDAWGRGRTCASWTGDVRTTVHLICFLVALRARSPPSSRGITGVVGSQSIYGSGTGTRGPAHHVLVDLTPAAWEAVRIGRAVIDDVLERKEVVRRTKQISRTGQDRIRVSTTCGML